MNLLHARNCQASWRSVTSTSTSTIPSVADLDRCYITSQRPFQPFATEPGHRHIDSVGLGLAICLGIARSLGGRITLDNCKQGTRTIGLDARVQLPLATSNDAISQPQAHDTTRRH